MICIRIQNQPPVKQIYGLLNPLKRHWGVKSLALAISYSMFFSATSDTSMPNTQGNCGLDLNPWRDTYNTTTKTSKQPARLQGFNAAIGACENAQMWREALELFSQGVLELVMKMA